MVDFNSPIPIIIYSVVSTSKGKVSPGHQVALQPPLQALSKDVSAVKWLNTNVKKNSVLTTTQKTRDCQHW